MIDDHTVEQYQRDGAVCLRRLFNADEIETLRAGIELNLEHLSERAIVASGADDPGRFVEDFCTWQDNELYRHFIFDSSLAETAGRLMRSTSARLYHDHMLTKEPRTRQKTPWHQDQPYYNIEGRQNVSFWIPVDPVSRESSLELIGGSHLGPWLMPRTFMDAQAKWFPEGTLGDLPDIDGQREAFPILSWDLQPGDAVCFHMLTLHGARGVTGAHRRRVFSVRFMGDDIRHAPRRWKTSPEFPGLTEQLAAGAAMDHPLFPLLWSTSRRLANGAKLPSG
jgi:ectoine hydroxylase-related dioxygenase (phytanoyl-CoA dioxygenase family)